MNLTGFRKALKKFEKATGIHCMELYSDDKILKDKFAKGVSIDSLLKQMEELFTEHFGQLTCRAPRLSADEKNTAMPNAPAIDCAGSNGSRRSVDHLRTDAALTDSTISASSARDSASALVFHPWYLLASKVSLYAAFIRSAS